jgi:signal transduction histidine kinase
VGERPGGRTRTGNGDEFARDSADGCREDIDRIAGAVRGATGARAALVSRVIDDEWPEVVSVAGSSDLAAPAGSRWRRADLDRWLALAREAGPVDVSHPRGPVFLDIPPGDRTGVPGERPTLLARLCTASGLPLGVLSIHGPVEPAALDPATRNLIEAYAEQARSVLHHVAEQEVLAEQLRLAFAAEELLHRAGQQPDVAGALGEVCAGLAEMIDARVGWACVEIAAGPHAEAVSHPPEAVAQLGADICALVEPLVAACWRDDRSLTRDDAPLLGRLAGLVKQHDALLAAIGSGTGPRGALLVFRHAHDRPWTASERDIVRRLGRHVGTVVGHLEGHRRDLALVEELRELEAYRRDLVVSITHDLKTPLTAITLNTELLASGERLEDAGHHPVDAIRRSAQRLSGLVDDLLALARAEEGLLRAPESVGDLVAVLHDACRHAEPEAQLRGISFEVDAPDTLAVPVDADALSRVFVNVVANAVKFSLPNGQVRLSLARVGDVVEFTCVDTGIGISDEDQTAVFDMFTRSRDPLARELPGNGMGLAISQRILARLGGWIEVRSVQGEGSTFIVRVPIDASV